MVEEANGASSLGPRFPFIASESFSQSHGIIKSLWAARDPKWTWQSTICPARVSLERGRSVGQGRSTVRPEQSEMKLFFSVMVKCELSPYDTGRYGLYFFPQVIHQDEVSRYYILLLIIDLVSGYNGFLIVCLT